jgi:hypothetical protein
VTPITGLTLGDKDKKR